MTLHIETRYRQEPSDVAFLLNYSGLIIVEIYLTLPSWIHIFGFLWSWKPTTEYRLTHFKNINMVISP